MGFPTPDVPMNHIIAPAMYFPRIWTCATCRTEGQLTFRRKGRHAGWVVTCPCPACPAPDVPAGEYNPTQKGAIRHWNWKQGGPR
jgi:hypothetical protein